MDNQRPLISIVTVVYNAVSTIEYTIKSIVSQTYSDLEYIIIDGGSDDGTLEIVMRYTDKIHLIISEKDDGIFDAMNKGLRFATGKYINFMNSGDSIANNKVIEDIFSFSAFNYDFVFGDTIVNRKEKLFLKKAKPFFKKRGINAMGICHQSMFIKTELAKKYFFDTDLKLSADYKMVYCIFQEVKPSIFYFNKPISIFDTNNSLSTKEYRKTFKEILKIYHYSSSFQKYSFFLKSSVRYSLSSFFHIFW